MNIRDGFIATIGNTPLIKLKKASELTGCTILGKAEFLNPGGSVKDRAALAIIEDAEKRGEIRKGGLIVEGTAGNTGIGLALVGNARGYKSLIVIPDTQSQEKKDMLPLAGVAMALKERNKNVKIACADPQGAAMFSYFTTGELKSEGTSITEGIGQGRVTKNVDGTPVDFAYRIPDSEALPIVFDLIKEEGLCMGGSTGINIAGAIRLAKELGPGHTIVTILADFGTRYQSKLFNPEFLRSKGLPTPTWMERRTGVTPPFEKV